MALVPVFAILCIPRSLHTVESGPINAYDDLDIMRYTVSKTKKKVAVTRRGSSKKKKCPVELPLEYPEAPLEAICDDPGMLRLSPAPNPVGVECGF